MSKERAFCIENVKYNQLHVVPYQKLVGALCLLFFDSRSLKCGH